MLGTALLLLAFQDLSSFEKTVTERRLENGMTFLIVERHEVPVVSFHLFADVGSIEERGGAFQAAEAEAGEYAMSDELTRVIEQAGGSGLNASTSNDATRYYISLPSNKAELWFSLESARFLEPVLRGFYKERDG